MASVELHILLGVKGDGFKRGRQEVVVSTHSMVPPSIALDEQELARAKKRMLARLRGAEEVTHEAKGEEKVQEGAAEGAEESSGNEGKDVAKKRISFKKQ